MDGGLCKLAAIQHRFEVSPSLGVPDLKTKNVYQMGGAPKFLICRILERPPEDEDDPSTS